MSETQFSVWAIRASDGRWFTHGTEHYCKGTQWTPHYSTKLTEAKIFRKISLARAAHTKISSSYGRTDATDLVQLSCRLFGVLDEEKRLTKVLRGKEEAGHRQDRSEAKRMLKEAQDRLEQAQRELDALRGKE
jgi:hypothetical protein